MAMRRCCEAGCTATQDGGSYAGNGWYRVGIGFMRHACPEHADVWRAEDKADRKHDEDVGDACRRMEALTEALIELHYPCPPPRACQSSTQWD